MRGTGAGARDTAQADAVPLEHRSRLDFALVLHVLGLEHALVVAEQPRGCEYGLVAEARRLQEVVVVDAVAVAQQLLRVTRDIVRQQCIVVLHVLTQCRDVARSQTSGGAAVAVETSEGLGAVCLGSIRIVGQVALVQIELLEVLLDVVLVDIELRGRLGRRLLWRLVAELVAALDLELLEMPHDVGDLRQMIARFRRRPRQVVVALVKREGGAHVVEAIFPETGGLVVVVLLRNVVELQAAHRGRRHHQWILATEAEYAPTGGLARIDVLLLPRSFVDQERRTGYFLQD